MRTAPTESKAAPVPSKRANVKSVDIASPPVPDELAALHVKPDTGPTQGEVLRDRSMLRQPRDRIDRTSTAMHISPKLQVARLAHS